MNHTRKALSVLLCGLLTVSLCACTETGSTGSQENTSAPAAASTASAQAEQVVSAVIPVDEDAPNKSESVYSETDAYGTPTDTTVEVTLKYPGEGKEITDVSDLTDIKNTEGDEEYTCENGVYVWENHGTDIHYEGKTEKELPVGVRVTYYLDDVETPAEQMAGASGNVRIRFDYENNTQQKIKIQKYDRDCVVPFAAVTAVILNEDFYNVKVSSGQVMSMDDSTIAVGMCLPGFQDALHPEDLQLTKDLEMDDYFEVTAYTTNFSLDFTLTAFSNGLFADMEEDDLQDLQDLANSMYGLEESSSSILSAIGSCRSAAAQLAGYASALDSGLSAVSGAISAAAGAQASLGALDSALSSLSYEISVLEEDGVDVSAVRSALSAAESARDSLRGQLASLSGADVSGLQQLSSGILSGLQELDSGLTQLKDGYEKFHNDGIHSLKYTAGDELLTLLFRFKAFRQADMEFTSFSGIQDGKECSTVFLFETAEIS